ncbi:TetR/AcrR family transcriptional regulator [Lichenibacterium minor]|uniref:TetR/AcrR family transcriptional regulator n=1 Tax=Lichenibacterium minor TaxID=2316528 RepID=UPI0013ED2D88|nr:TetR/AcrR family transcriptional regulator [Lichenibacterium minor]
MAASPETTLDVPQARDDGAKRRQILDGARRVFLSTGFDGASMNEVARASGVSKGTLYVYFASKEELFAALLRAEKREQAEQVCRFDDGGPDVRATLDAFGARFMDLLLRPDSLAHLRTVMAVAPKFPEIGRAYYEAGPETGRRRLAVYFDRQVEAGRLAMPDTLAAAQQFFDLCKAGLFLEVLLCVVPRPAQGEIEAQVKRAVDLFLRAYAAA